MSRRSSHGKQDAKHPKPHVGSSALRAGPEVVLPAAEPDSADTDLEAAFFASGEQMATSVPPMEYVVQPTTRDPHEPEEDPHPIDPERMACDWIKSTLLPLAVVSVSVPTWRTFGSALHWVVADIVPCGSKLICPALSLTS